MCTPFDTPLAEARRLHRGHKYAKQLNEMDKQHKFALLRSTYGGHYDAEMRQSLLVDRLFLIYEKLHLRPIARLNTKPISTPTIGLNAAPAAKASSSCCKIQVNFAARGVDAWKQYLAPSSTANASTPATKTKSNPKKGPKKAITSNTIFKEASRPAKVGYNCLPIK